MKAHDFEVTNICSFIVFFWNINYKLTLYNVNVLVHICTVYLIYDF